MCIHSIYIARPPVEIMKGGLKGLSVFSHWEVLLEVECSGHGQAKGGMAGVTGHVMADV